VAGRHRVQQGGSGVQLFISYTGADQAWAEWLAWQLEAAGHQAIVQAWDFRPGENFVVNMRWALDSADRTLAVVSAAYLESVYGSDEWTAAFLHNHADMTSLLVVRVEEVPLPRLLRPWIYIDLAGVEAEAAAQRLLQGLQRGRRKPDQPPPFPMEVSREGGPRFPGRGPVIWNLPPRNPAFTGRDDLLAQLRAQLARSTGSDGPVAVVAQALYGLGEVGKTQLALEYAHRFAADYDLAWWIPSENSLTIPAALARLAPKLGIATSADQEEVVAAVLDALRTRDRWLLVFDNAQQPADLARWQPAGGSGHVLVTSRNPPGVRLAKPCMWTYSRASRRSSCCCAAPPTRTGPAPQRWPRRWGICPWRWSRPPPIWSRPACRWLPTWPSTAAATSGCWPRAHQWPTGARWTLPGS
jgi:TIR domain